MRDLRKEVSKQIHWIDFYLECLENWKNISIYTIFGRSHPMVLIDDYDEMVHRGPFRLYHIRWIADGGLGFDPLISVIKRIRLLLSNRDPTIKMCPPRVSSGPL